MPLSKGEFSLLAVFLGAPNRTLSRHQLLSMSRLPSDDVYNRSVETQVLQLRRKLDSDPTNPRYICTERGAGYLFVHHRSWRRGRLRENFSGWA